jgi:hypothetical protein
MDGPNKESGDGQMSYRIMANRCPTCIAPEGLAPSPETADFKRLVDEGKVAPAEAAIAAVTDAAVGKDAGPIKDNNRLVTSPEALTEVLNRLRGPDAEIDPGSNGLYNTGIDRAIDVIRSPEKYGIQREMRLLNDLLPHCVKCEIGDNITIEGRTKTDVVQDIWDELVQRGLVREPTQEAK